MRRKGKSSLSSALLLTRKRVHYIIFVHSVPQKEKEPLPSIHRIYFHKKEDRYLGERLATSLHTEQCMAKLRFVHKASACPFAKYSITLESWGSARHKVTEGPKIGKSQNLPSRAECAIDRSLPCQPPLLPLA